MTFFLVLLALAILLALLGWWRKIYPRRPLVWMALFPAVLSIGLLLSPRFGTAILALDALIVLVALVDLATLPAAGWFECRREMQRIASLKNPHAVKLTVVNRSRWNLAVWVRDDVPDECEATPAEFALKLPPHARSRFEYSLAARRRGAFRLEAVYLRVASRLGLWQRHLRYEQSNELHVYPDMRQMSRYALLARSDRLSLMGVRRARRIGQDNEFERLRDFTLDDNYKYIEWRSTARRQKLTVKDFQLNQSQRVIFLIDSGRMMTNRWQDLSLLDHAFNAVLMLSYVALGKGDSVGWLSFSDEIERFVPPRGGMNQMNRLLHASFDRFPRMVESRYDQAFMYLNARCRKRALVILVTNLIDEVNAYQVNRYLARLVGRHLPLAVLLRDHAVFDVAATRPTSDETFFQAAAAAQIVAWRDGVLADLHGQGVLSLDVFPEQVTAPLVNRYLEIKARHLL